MTTKFLLNHAISAVRRMSFGSPSRERSTRYFVTQSVRRTERQSLRLSEHVSKIASSSQTEVELIGGLGAESGDVVGVVEVVGFQK